MGAATGVMSRDSRRRKSGQIGSSQRLKSYVAAGIGLVLVVAIVMWNAGGKQPSRRTAAMAQIERSGGWSGGRDASRSQLRQMVEEPHAPLAQPQAPRFFKGTVVAEYEHAPEAFTQGILVSTSCTGGAAGACEDVFLESTGEHARRHKRSAKRNASIPRHALLTQPHSALPSVADLNAAPGLYGQSSIRKVDMRTGAVLKKTSVHRRHFGEGLTRWGDVLLQLTWKTPTVLMYDAETLEPLGEKQTELSDGWGLTNDSTHLIATDSGHTLYFLDPETLQTQRAVPIMDHAGRPVKALNELEYVRGEVWANIWNRNCIARIDPTTGVVAGWIMLDDLVHRERQRSASKQRRPDVLNGIAFDPKSNRLFLTGKLWTTVYEVEISPNDVLGGEAQAACIVP